MALETDVEKVRTYIGDFDSSDYILTDEQIDFALSEEGSVRAAAALAADWCSAKFSRLADKSIGDLSISHGQKAKNYAALAARLRSTTAATALPYAGGISQSAKETREADTDRVRPSFTIDMLDTPGLDGSAEEDA